MVLSYDEDSEEEYETENDYLDHLDGDSWGGNVQGDWKDLE